MRSDRDTGGAPARLALTTRGPSPPAGYEPVRLPHARGIVLIRVRVSGDADYRAVDPLRKQASCRAA